MIGSTISHYRIIDKLGRGGMGEVYRAEDSSLHRHVAVKVLPVEFAHDAERLARFQREAHVLASLNHPNIAAIYGLEETDGNRFIIMELVEGETMAQRLVKGPFAIGETLEFCQQVAGALEAAHEKGVIHRDLKPANIMITEKAVVKLLDFGLAKLTASTLGPDSSEDETKTAQESLLTESGTILGTVAYMSPEQVEGKPVGARSDIFSFGAVLYEMLTGTRAFHGDSRISTMSAILRETPAKMAALRTHVPAALERIVTRCLEKDAARRYTAAELHHKLTDCRARFERSQRGLRSLVRKPWLAIPSAVLLIVFVTVGVWLGVRAKRIQWAEKTALLEIARLAEQRKFAEAFKLAEDAERLVPRNRQLEQLWPRISVRVTIESDPTGAEVEMKPYRDVTGPWTKVGRSPITGLRIPQEYFRWRLTVPGFEPLERTGPVPGATPKMTVRLARIGSAEAGMVYSPPGTFRQNLAGFGYLGPFAIDAYWIDKFEVTNRQFKQFVDAGGYEKREYWNEPFVRNGRTLSWEEAIAGFVDATARPGPSTWEAGTYADKKDDYPVGGVSWFEAAAYAQFARKSLPTLYHWIHSAEVRFSAYSLPFSNYGRAGPVPVGSLGGIAGPGVHDTGGNVREWCWNKATGGRYILGGAWDTPRYLREWSEVRDPFDRSPSNGFRCVKYTPGYVLPERFAAPIDRPFRDYTKEKPISDETFRVVRSLYARDPRPLNPVVVSQEAESEHWTKLKVAYDAGYGAERIPAYLFLPKHAAPPFQAVLFFPGASTILQRDSKTLLQESLFEFVIKSGRALLYPIYYGTYERQAGVVIAEHNREQVMKWVSEVSRSVDFLASRPDIQRDRIAYYGWSWGGHMAPIFLSLERRFRTAVLGIGGLLSRPRTTETDEFNFVPRVTIPVLMCNARNDFIFPLQTSVEPMFRLLGTPPEDKRLAVFDGGHGVFDRWSDIMREVLDWLDRYLGPVRKR